MKAVIIDDEQTSREILRNYIAKYCKDLSIAGEAENIQSGYELISTCNPDLVFLDVEMPMGNGFDLLEKFDEIRFETIFVTAFDHYAIQALNYSAAHYILKPVSIDELIAAVEKIKKIKAKAQSPVQTRVLMDNIKPENKLSQKIVLPLQDGFEVVNVRDVIHCEACDNFTNFYFLNKRKMMICRTLKYYEELLQDLGFLRVHKSHLININQVVKYTRGKGGQVTMSDKTIIDVSPNKKDDFLKVFKV